MSTLELLTARASASRTSGVYDEALEEAIIYAIEDAASRHDVEGVRALNALLVELDS